MSDFLPLRGVRLRKFFGPVLPGYRPPAFITLIPSLTRRTGPFLTPIRFCDSRTPGFFMSGNEVAIPGGTTLHV
jgi:hypothetical protein